MTEKQYAPTKNEKKMTSKKVETPEVKTPAKIDDKKNEKIEENKKEEFKEKESKKKLQKKIKKDFAIVNGISMHISTKYSISLCNFIKKKNIDRAISDIEDVLAMRKSVPMKGEIPHRKGPGKVGSGAGRFPIKAAEVFHMLLKSLKANANANDMENPIITEAYANQASRPMGRFGRWQRKRTHVFIKVTEKKVKEEKK